MSGPFVVRSTSDALVVPATNAVKAAAPFFPFPESLAQKEKDFTMDFLFE